MFTVLHNCCYITYIKRIVCYYTHLVNIVHANVTQVPAHKLMIDHCFAHNLTSAALAFPRHWQKLINVNQIFVQTKYA